MSFKREGDDLSELNIVKKRRVEELLSRDIPDDEAYLMKNGRFACLVCSHQPVLDTVEMLCVHRDGKRHKQCAEHFFRKKREFHQLVEKRRQELSLHSNGADSTKNTQAPLLMRTHAASQNALLRYAPYNPISSGAQSGQNSTTEDFKTKRSKTKGFFEYTRNYLTNNVPARDGRLVTNITSQQKKQLNPSVPGNSHQSLLKSNKVHTNSERTVSMIPVAEVEVRPYISKKRRKEEQATGAIQEKQTSGTTLSVKQVARYVENKGSTDINEQDEDDDKWESISQFPPLRESKVFEVDSQIEGSRCESKNEGAVDAHVITSHSATFDNSCNRVNRDSGSHRKKVGIRCKSNTEGSIHAEGPTSNSASLQNQGNPYAKDGSCHDTEGSRHVGNEFKRIHNDSIPTSDTNCRQFGSLKRVTHSKRDALQRAIKRDQNEITSTEKANSVTGVEQNRKIGENRPCLIQGSAVKCDEGILQESDSGNHSSPAHQFKVTSVEKPQADVNLHSLKSKPPESSEINKKNEQPVKFKIGMLQKERTFMNQRPSSEGISSYESESKADVSKNVHRKEKVKANPATKPPSKYSEERKQELQRHLALTSSGWVRDAAGRWVKDEDVEFDSDEDEPV